MAGKGENGKKAQAQQAAPVVGCPCGCGFVSKGKGIFGTGHDGRVAGWLLALVSGQEKRIAKIPKDREQIAKEAHRRWLAAGQPGGTSHPKVRELFG